MGKMKWIIAKGMKRLLNPPAIRDGHVDRTAHVGPGCELTHVAVGRYTYFGARCFAVSARIGSFCSIADGCRIGGAVHPLDRVSTSPVFHKGRNVLRRNYADLTPQGTPETVIEHDVWMGADCLVKSGVTIHTGAVIGMGSVVTHDVPAYEIWAGNPARRIRDRFDSVTREKLLRSEWWTYPDEKLSDAAARFGDVTAFLTYIEDREDPV